MTTYHYGDVTVTLENPEAIPALQRDPRLLAAVAHVLELAYEADAAAAPPADTGVAA